MFSGTRINVNIGEEAGSALADNLTENYTLTELNMAGNCVRQKVDQSRSDLFNRIMSICASFIAGTRFTDAGAMAIKALLENNCTLTTLDLSYCKSLPVSSSHSAYAVITLMMRTFMS